MQNFFLIALERTVGIGCWSLAKKLKKSFGEQQKKATSYGDFLYDFYPAR